MPLEVDLDINGAIDIEFGGTNAKDAPGARSNLGLGNVDNTSDAGKPVSTLTQTELDKKVTGPATATDSAVALYDGTTGELVKDGPSIGTSPNNLVQLDGGGTLSSSLSEYNQGGTGSGDRTVESRLQDIVSIRDYAPLGDGATVEQTGIAAAVAHSFSTGDRLYWADGTYLSNASIPNFHDVKHFGPGIVKRGSDLFTLTAKDGDTNLINVSATGSAANDGLTTSEPTTLTQSAEILKNYGPSLFGSWRIILASDTYPLGDLTIVNRLYSTERIRVQGPSVGGSPNVPTAIIVQNDVSDVNGLEFIGAFCTVKDIKFTGYDDASAGSPLLARENSDLFCDNVHVNTTSWTGINAQNRCRLRVQGGIIENAANGIRVYANSAYEIGDNSVAVTIKNCTTSGVKAQNSSTGTVSASAFEGNAIGLLLLNNSRARTSNNTFLSNTVGVNVRAGSTWFRTTTNTFTTNTEDFNIEAGCTELDIAPGSISDQRYSDSSQTVHTGDTLLTETNNIHSIAADYFINPRQRIFVRAWGTATGAGGTKEVGYRFDSNNISTPVAGIPSGGVDWFYELTVIPLTATTQKAIAKTSVNNATVSASTTRTINMAAIHAGKFFVQLSNAGDSITVEHVEVSVGG